MIKALSLIALAAASSAQNNYYPSYYNNQQPQYNYNQFPNYYPQQNYYSNNQQISPYNNYYPYNSYQQYNPYSYNPYSYNPYANYQQPPSNTNVQSNVAGNTHSSSTNSVTPGTNGAPNTYSQSQNQNNQLTNQQSYSTGNPNNPYAPWVQQSLNQGIKQDSSSSAQYTPGTYGQPGTYSNTKQADNSFYSQYSSNGNTNGPISAPSFGTTTSS